MPGFTESNITLNFPDNNFFRFSDCDGYKRLSGNYFKEMDAGWYNAQENLYWLIELKDYSLANLSVVLTIEEISNDIVKKAIDSLCMLLSSKHAYPFAPHLNLCLPQVPNSNAIFNFITVVHSDRSQRVNVQLINEKFKRRFRPYAQLFGIKFYSVIEHTSAARIIPNNIIQ